jgi:hypothetical protein
MKFFKQNSKKGSAMVFVIILITNALVIISSMVFLTVMQSKSSAVLYLTPKAFQLADSGVEGILKAINDAGEDPFNSSIKDLKICEDFSSKGVCTLDDDGDLKAWFFDKEEDNSIITDEDTSLENIKGVKVLAKVKKGSNVVSRALKVDLLQPSSD